jgi:hypothetical protein
MFCLTVCWSFAATWGTCSSADKVCCANPGDACVYKNDKWSRCEPKNGKEAGVLMRVWQSLNPRQCNWQLGAAVTAAVLNR